MTVLVAPGDYTYGVAEPVAHLAEATRYSGTRYKSQRYASRTVCGYDLAWLGDGVSCSAACSSTRAHCRAASLF